MAEAPTSRTRARSTSCGTTPRASSCSARPIRRPPGAWRNSVPTDPALPGSSRYARSRPLARASATRCSRTGASSAASSSPSPWSPRRQRLVHPSKVRLWHGALLLADAPTGVGESEKQTGLPRRKPHPRMRNGRCRINRTRAPTTARGDEPPGVPRGAGTDEYEEPTSMETQVQPADSTDPNRGRGVTNHGPRSTGTSRQAFPLPLTMVPPTRSPRRRRIPEVHRAHCE